MKMQGGIGDGQDIFPLGDDERDVRRHAGFQFVIRIGHTDDTIVSDDIVGVGRRIANLHNFAVK
jgi:hypothetical protein